LKFKNLKEMNKPYKYIKSLLFCAMIFPFSLSAQIGVGAEKPESAEMLFDGSKEMLEGNWTYWEGPRLKAELPIKWEIVSDPVDEGTVLSSNDPSGAGGLYGAADIVTQEKFRDFRLHVEFFVQDEGGNSGVYLQNRYEIQILDGDYGVHGLAAIINEHIPTQEAYNGVGKWNAYDINFKAARFENGKLTEKARVTIYFNGKKIHEDKSIQQVWGGPNSGLDGGNDGGKGITDQPGGIKLQAEGHEVLYRNIWIEKVDLGEKGTDF
jgi:hypothetical protein